MIGGTLARRSAFLGLVAIAFAVAIQPPLGLVAMAVGTLTLVACTLAAALAMLAALRRGQPMLARGALPLGLAAATLVGIVGGGLLHRARWAAAKSDAERFVPLLDAHHQRTGRYPLHVDDLPDAPPRPAFSGPGFYATSEDRSEFTLHLAYPTWLIIDTWTDWSIYESRTRRWTDTD